MSNKILIKTKFDPKIRYNLIFNDAITILETIPDEFVDHCITDPPYNISGYDHKKVIGWLKSSDYWTKTKKFLSINEDWDKFTNDNYELFTTKWLSEILRIVKPNGNLIIFGTYHNIFKIGSILQKLDRKIINSIVWFKRNAFPNITQRMLCESTEYIIWAVNNNQKKAKNWIFNYKDLKELNPIKICFNCNNSFNSKNKYCPRCGNSTFKIQYTQMRNVWDIPSTPPSEKNFGKHPSQKPIEVIKRLIIGASKEEDIVIDPFIGSGTIPLVAKSLKRYFIGIDNKKEYCQIAQKRLNSATQ